MADASINRCPIHGSYRQWRTSMKRMAAMVLGLISSKTAKLGDIGEQK
jgi:hypothetical protein